MNAQRNVIRWEDPPPSQGVGRETPWNDVAAQLRARPGEWAVLTMDAAAPTLSNHISQGKITAFRPAGAFEATGRRGLDGYIVYARYVGGACEHRFPDRTTCSLSAAAHLEVPGLAEVHGWPTTG